MKTNVVDKNKGTYLIPNSQELCASCGARCCKPILTGKDRYLLYLRTGDVTRMEKDGLGVFVLVNSTRSNSKRLATRYAIVPHIFGYCPFLDLQTSACTIYDQRPRACRIYPNSLSEEYLTTLYQLSGDLLASMNYEEAQEYGLTHCLLHQHTPQEEYLKQVDALLEADIQKMPDIPTLLKNDEEAALQLRYRQLHFFLIDQLYMETDPEIRQHLLQHQPQIPHILDNEHKEGSFLISGPHEVIQHLLPPLLKLIKRYQVITKQTPLYLYITLVGRVPPTHQDRFPGLQFVPLLQVRGIMGKNQQQLSVQEILKKIRLQSRTNQLDGRFLMGIVLYEDLSRDLSYWQAYWEELKQTLLNQKRDAKPLRRKKPRPPQTNPPPFRPRRRR